MDRGASQPIVRGVAKSRTWLSDQHTPRFENWGPAGRNDLSQGHTETQVTQSHRVTQRWYCGPCHLDPGPWGSGSEVTVFSVTPLPRWWGGVSIIQDAQDLYVGMCKENTRTYISVCCLFILNFYWGIVALQCCISFYCTASMHISLFWISFLFRSPQGTE